MVDQLTEQQIAQFKEDFARFDKDGDGIITAKDLATVKGLLGQNATEGQLWIIKEIEINGNTGFLDFLNLMAKQLHS